MSSDISGWLLVLSEVPVLTSRAASCSAIPYKDKILLFSECLEKKQGGLPREEYSHDHQIIEAVGVRMFFFCAGGRRKKK